MVSDNQIVDWKIIHAELEKQLGTKIYYTRYNKEDKSGHFVVNKFLIDEEKKQKVYFNGENFFLIFFEDRNNRNEN